MKIQATELADAMQSILAEELDASIKSVPEAVETVASQTASTLENEAKSKGIGGRKYVNSFKVQTEVKNSFITSLRVYSTQYQLTHLLENGHAIRNQYGSYSGTTRAFPHWATAEAEAANNLENAIKQAIGR